MSRILRGLGALAALVALLAGVPITLWRFVGQPWPRSLPALETIWSSVRAGDISDATVIKALAVLVWIAWARLAISVVIEVAARLASSQTPHVIGLGSAQKWAAGLIATVVLLIGAGPRGAVAAAPGLRPISTALLQRDPVGPVIAEVPRFEAPPEPAAWPTFGPRPLSIPATSTHLVGRYESFWSIAEDELGDGARWREIVEVNRGREVAPGVVFDGTPNRLLPGWVLVVPTVDPVSAAVSASVSAPGSSEPTTVRVERGDTLSEIAEEQLGDATEWPQLWEANRGRDFAGRVFDDPNLIIPGWELVVPAVFAPPVATDVPITQPPVRVAQALPSVDVNPMVEVSPMVEVVPIPAPPAPPPAVAPAVPTPTAVAAVDSNIPTPVVRSAGGSGVEPGSSRAAADDDESEGVMSLPGGMGTAILLASGVMAAVVSRRRRRMRGAAVNARLSDPSSLAGATESLLRSLGDGERIARLDIALRAAAAELITIAPGTAVLGAIVGADGGIDLLLTGAVIAVPEPWVSVTAHRWRLSPTIALDRLAAAARRANQPCPAIAHIGSTINTDTTGNERAAASELFVDLEATGLLTIEGDAVQAANVLRAIAVAVAVSPMAEIAHLIVTGLDGVLLDHPLSSEADSLDMALDLAAAAIGTTAATTTATLSTFTLRARHQRGEAWEPAIVFAAGADGATDADLVGLTATSGRGLGVVVDRAVHGALWRLVQQPHHWVLHPLGLEVTPVGLTLDDIDCVRVLLDEADRPPFYDFEREQPDPDPDSGPSVWTDADWSLMVRVLGPVEVIDRGQVAVDFERSKALELVVWLSQHRDRSTRAGARTALWDLDVRDATFANVVSDARRALARLVPPIGNEEWIGRTLTEQLPLHRAVITDADLLGGRLDHARNRSAADAIDILRPGLELVRDMPFCGTSYLWPDTEGITSHLTLLVTSAATTLAGHYLAIGDTAGVFWATGQGLKVLAGHEELIALRMRAHARQGDLAGVRQEWASYERVLNADSWSSGDPAPKLVALRRELLASSLLAS